MSNREAVLMDFLNNNYMCKTLTDKEIETFLEFTEVVEAHKGDVIAEIGEVGQALYFVVKGEVALIHDDGSQEVEMTRVLEGELMGEMSFFDRKPRMLRMRALRDRTLMLRLTRAMYKRLRVEQPYIAVNLLEYTIISLDHYFRRLSQDVAHYTHLLYAPGKK
ncbi:MAG: cyclic nucleotide-binding domain-containing protein [Gammaproteobacteria bacterium]